MSLRHGTIWVSFSRLVRQVSARARTLESTRRVCGLLMAVLGATMEPVSWLEMRCPKTGKIERRKCAKPEDMLS